MIADRWARTMKKVVDAEGAVLLHVEEKSAIETIEAAADPKSFDSCNLRRCGPRCARLRGRLDHIPSGR